MIRSKDGRRELRPKGVGLGMGWPCPGCQMGFEAKETWSLEFTEEGFRDKTTGSYKSAEENAEDIEKQVMEAVQGRGPWAQRW